MMQAAGLRHDMHPRLQSADRQGRVLVKVVGQDHRIHVVAKKFIEVGIGRHAEFSAGDCEPLFPGIANRHQLQGAKRGDIPGKGLPAVHADDTDTDGLHLVSSTTNVIARASVEGRAILQPVTPVTGDRFAGTQTTGSACAEKDDGTGGIPAPARPPSGRLFC